MNDFDKEIKKIMKKEVNLSEDFKDSIRETINNCTHNPKKEHTLINLIKKIIATILVGASTITVYAVTTRNIDFSKLELRWCCCCMSFMLTYSM